MSGEEKRCYGDGEVVYDGGGAEQHGQQREDDDVVTAGASGTTTRRRPTAWCYWQGAAARSGDDRRLRGEATAVRSGGLWQMLSSYMIAGWRQPVGGKALAQWLHVEGAQLVVTADASRCTFSMGGLKIMGESLACFGRQQ